MTEDEVCSLIFFLDTLMLVFCIHSVKGGWHYLRMLWKELDMVEALKLLVHFFYITLKSILSFPFPCDIAVLIWFHWFEWEKDYFRILKLAQERCSHLFPSKSGSSCHWLYYWSVTYISIWERMQPGISLRQMHCFLEHRDL